MLAKLLLQVPQWQSTWFGLSKSHVVPSLALQKGATGASRQHDKVSHSRIVTSANLITHSNNHGTVFPKSGIGTFNWAYQPVPLCGGLLWQTQQDVASLL
eukprot:4269436-Amphidinium_carterae.1